MNRRLRAQVSCINEWRNSNKYQVQLDTKIRPNRISRVGDSNPELGQVHTKWEIIRIFLFPQSLGKSPTRKNVAVQKVAASRTHLFEKEIKRRRSFVSVNTNTHTQLTRKKCESGHAHTHTHTQHLPPSTSPRGARELEKSNTVRAN
jgi:hypothetical protein